MIDLGVYAVIPIVVKINIRALVTVDNDNSEHKICMKKYMIKYQLLNFHGNIDGQYQTEMVPILVATFVFYFFVMLLIENIRN